MGVLAKVKKLISDKQGNIAFTFAIALLPVMLTIAAAIDYSDTQDLIDAFRSIGASVGEKLVLSR